MHLHVLNSRSAGNGYIIEAEESALIIECGVPFAKVREAVDISKIQGVIVSHRHMDHVGRWKEYIQYGLHIYGNEDTISYLGIGHWGRKIVTGSMFKVGDFGIMPFGLIHDVPTNGFLIRHPEMGKMCFITDTSQINAKFPFTDHWLIEANYDYGLMNELVKDGKLRGQLFNRVQESHMSIEDTIKFMQMQDHSATKTVTLLHLSDSNSDADGFKSRIEQAIGRPVVIADSGMKINLNKTRF
jgi:phosphoribosyl 1,2-cyclic phosphodiesterase